MSEKIKKILKRKAKVPQGVLPELKEVSLAEQKLTQMIDRVEHGLRAQGRTSREHRRWGDCNTVPDIFSVVALDEGRRHGFEVDVRQYQVADMHKAIGGSYDEAFRHGLNTISLDGESFLVDLSFAQFIGKNGVLRSGPEAAGDNYSSGVSNDNPLAQQLIKAGFVPLTAENLQEYLRITTQAEDRSYIFAAQPSMLDGVKTLPVEVFESDGVDSNYGLTPHTDPVVPTAV